MNIAHSRFTIATMTAAGGAVLALVAAEPAQACPVAAAQRVEIVGQRLVPLQRVVIVGKRQAEPAVQRIEIVGQRQHPQRVAALGAKAATL